jgi:uncharacterized Zn finger protein
MVHCLECGLVYVASGIKIPNKISVRVFVNRIENPFTHCVKLDSGEFLQEDEEIVLNAVKTSAENPFIITSLQTGVRRVPFALAEELDTIWARPLDEITFGKKRKVRQKHPISPENMKPVIGVSIPSKTFKIVQET